MKADGIAPDHAPNPHRLPSPSPCPAPPFAGHPGRPEGPSRDLAGRCPDGAKRAPDLGASAFFNMAFARRHETHVTFKPGQVSVWLACRLCRTARLFDPGYPPDGTVEKAFCSSPKDASGHPSAATDHFRGITAVGGDRVLLRR